MKILAFELKKLWHQRKFMWVFLLVLLGISGLFTQNYMEQEDMGERALEELRPLQENTYRIRGELDTLRREEAISDQQVVQLDFIREMSAALMYWESAIDHGNWADIPQLEWDFLTSMEKYEEAGGQYDALVGMEREIAVAKNEWLLSHQLPYEDEKYPISPHLNLKDSSLLFFGVIGIAILLLFFGGSLTIEKEQRTWLTLKTQPISNRKLVLGKFGSVLFTLLIYVAMVLSVGVTIPLVFGGHGLNLYYPQVTVTGENFMILSTAEFVVRSIVLFLCASMVALSISFLLSKWMKRTFSVVLATACILFVGYLITESNISLQGPWNLFDYLRFGELLTMVPNGGDWLYLLFTLIWSSLLITLTVFLRERDVGQSERGLIKQPFRKGKTYSHSFKIRNISLFEWRKLQRNTMIKQIYFLLLLGIALGYFLISQQASVKEEVYLENLRISAYESPLTNTMEEQITSFKEIIQEAEEAGDEWKAENYRWLMELREEAIVFIRGREEMQKAALEGLERGDWIPFYEYQLFENEFVNDTEAFASGNYKNPMKENYGQFTVDVSIAEKQWLMEHQIPPVFSGEYVSTIHEHWQSYVPPVMIEEWREDNRKIDNSGLFSVYLFFEEYVYFIPIVLFLYLLGGGLASERGKKGTLNFLLTQPISRKDVFLGKVLNSSVVFLMSGVGILVLLLGIGSLFHRFGDWMYPVLHYNSDKAVHSESYEGMISAGYGYHFLPLGEIVVQNSILFLLITLFLLMTSLVLSIFLRNLLSVFTTTTIIAVAGFWLSSQFLSTWRHLSPFTYLDISRITNGEIATLVNNPAVNFQSGIIVLSGVTAVLLVVGYKVKHGDGSRASSKDI